MRNVELFGIENIKKLAQEFVYGMPTNILSNFKLFNSIFVSSIFSDWRRTRRKLLTTKKLFGFGVIGILNDLRQVVLATNVHREDK